jgi:UDP-N-acetylglucosamine acyltransferase
MAFPSPTLNTELPSSQPGETRTVTERIIHPTAIIDPTAEIGEGVNIGAYCIVGKNSRIGDFTVMYPHSIVEENTTIGKHCEIFSGAILGGRPQDVKYDNEPTYLEIGDYNTLREYVTIHRATGEGCVTRVGSHNLIMAYVHIGHNCCIGSNITLASYAGISGHVEIEDYVNVGGLTGIHQGCRIGTLAMLGGFSRISTNIPPYMLVSGIPEKEYDINKIGLRRAGISPKVRGELKQAYRLIYRSNLNMTQALETIEVEIEKSPELDHLIQFIRSSRNGKDFRGHNSEA